MSKAYITAGVLVRGSVRRWCELLDIEYKEDKGFLDSMFILNTTKDKFDKLIDAVDCD